MFGQCFYFWYRLDAFRHIYKLNIPPPHPSPQPPAVHMNSAQLGVQKGEVILQRCQEKSFSRNSGCANLDSWSLGGR